MSFNLSGFFEAPIRNCSVYYRKERRLDGLCNDFKNVETGSFNYRFGELYFSPYSSFKTISVALV